MSMAGEGASAHSVWLLNPSHFCRASRRHVFTGTSHRHPLACWRRGSRTAATAARRHQPTCTAATAARRHQPTCTAATAARRHQPTCTAATAARRHQPTCGAPAVRRHRSIPTQKSLSCKTPTWRAYTTYFEALRALWHAHAGCLLRVLVHAGHDAGSATSNPAETPHPANLVCLFVGGRVARHTLRFGMIIYLYDHVCGMSRKQYRLLLSSSLSALLTPYCTAHCPLEGSRYSLTVHGRL